VAKGIQKAMSIMCTYFVRLMGLNQTTNLIKHLYLSDTWLGVDLRTNLKNTRVWKRSDYMLECANHSRFNSELKLGTPVWPLNDHKNLHFDNE
jgi:hypothetical protein